MSKIPPIIYFTAPKLLLLALGIGFSFTLVGQAQAQNAPSSTSTTTRQVRPRLRATFFEEERRLRRFGFGDFLRSALDSEQNAFADPAKISNFAASNSNPLYERPGDIQGTLSVASTNEDNPNYLVTNFNSEFGNLTFTNVQQNSSFQTGTLTVNGTVLANGRNITFANTRANYSAGASNKDDNVSAVILVTDPNDPTRSIFIQLPPTNIAGFDDLESIPPTPAGLSIGIPTDR